MTLRPRPAAPPTRAIHNNAILRLLTIPLLLRVSAFGLPLEAPANGDGRRPRYDEWGVWVNREQCSIADLLFWIKDGYLFKRCAADSFCHGYIRPPAADLGDEVNSLRRTQLPMAKYSFLGSLREQWGRPVPLVTEDLTGKVVLVTGANIGLGFEAAKHFASMNPERLIIACRSESKGNQAVNGNPSTRSFVVTRVGADADALT